MAAVQYGAAAAYKPPTVPTSPKTLTGTGMNFLATSPGAPAAAPTGTPGVPTATTPPGTAPPTAAGTAAANNTSPLGQVLNTAGGMGGGSQNGGVVGGYSAPTQPQITAQPIFTPDQIDAQVNSAVGQNNMKAQSAYHNALEQLAGKGFGANSPQSEALKSRYDYQSMVANSQARSQIPFQYAQQNAQQMLAGQQAQEGQFGARQNEGIAIRRDDTTRLGQILGLLGSMF